MIMLGWRADGRTEQQEPDPGDGIVSAPVMIVWFVFFPPPEPPVDLTTPTTTAEQAGTDVAPAATADASTGDAQAVEPVPEAPRLTIDTPKLGGTISLPGGRIDDLSLKTYRETLDPASPKCGCCRRWARSIPITP
jgi:YidC/Oxa1 family membrane protein insertase